MNPNDTFHLISNTHWDREWRFPFQRNRQMLVDMIDAVLDILEKYPDYRAFHLDSQSIVIKDYLEIKPQNKERIIQLTLQNRLLHGPWYILPEEFQVGGENLIRNLLLGHKVSRAHGGVSKIGYSPFSWGQISQLPQIYKQFNIDLIMFYRGINSIDSPKSEFLWEGADGTRMVASRFSTMPRYNFYFYIYRPVVHNEGFYDVEYPWGAKGTPFHFADKNQHLEDYFIISPHTAYFPENIVPQVEKIIQDQAADFTTPHKIWMEGHDSSGPNAQTVQIVNDIKRLMPHVNVVHSTLEDYAAKLAESVDEKNLKLVQGERRSSQNNNRCGNLFGYTTSARMYLKQANFDAERWIQYYAEPFNVFSAWAGRDINDQYPETAWELIVQNSAHDSIGGCSLDRIHEDMMIRYKHAIEISKGIFERSLKYILPQLNTAAFGADENAIFITAVNPINHKRSQVTEAWIDIPVKQDLGSFKVVDEQGREIPCQIVERKPHQHVLEQMINRPMFFDMVRYRAFLQLQEVPSFGLKAFKAIPASPAVIEANNAASLTLENQYLKIGFNEDGSLNIFDKENNKEYRNTAYLLDEGDAGHAWVFKKEGKDVSTLGSRAIIRKGVSGPIYNEVLVSHQLSLPPNLKERQSSIPSMLVNKVDVKVILRADSRYVEFEVMVDNQSESHRLRMMFPTGLEAEKSFGEGQFDVPARNIRHIDATGWIEQPMYDYPMHHFVDVCDQKLGAAVLTDGLKEYEVLEDDHATLVLTLFRTYEYKINPAAPQDYSYEKGAQMLGTSSYRLAFFPHKGNWVEGKVFEQAQKYNYDLRLVQTGQLSGSKGSSAEFMSIEPSDLIFSTLKKAEDSHEDFVLRLYNPTVSEIRGKVRLDIPLERISLITLEEEHINDIKTDTPHSFEVVAPAGKILSYRIQTKKR